MINILIPCMGKSLFFKDSYFPKPLIEVSGETMLEKVVKNYEALKDARYLFVFGKSECSEFHLDESARLLTNGNCETVLLENETAGALCTCLMAVEHINNDTPLMIVNSDQILDVDYHQVLAHFQDADAGVITFESIHPRWSYARIQGDEVVEVAEKRPLSKHAIAGFYYFQKGSDFIECAKRVILKDNHKDGRFYISASINEMILEGKKVAYFAIPKTAHHSFYSPEKIKEYERQAHGGSYEDSED